MVYDCYKIHLSMHDGDEIYWGAFPKTESLVNNILLSPCKVIFSHGQTSSWKWMTCHVGQWHKHSQPCHSYSVCVCIHTTHTVFVQGFDLLPKTPCVETELRDVWLETTLLNHTVVPMAIVIYMMYIQMLGSTSCRSTKNIVILT